MPAFDLIFLTLIVAVKGRHGRAVIGDRKLNRLNTVIAREPAVSWWLCAPLSPCVYLQQPTMATQPPAGDNVH